MCDLSDGEAPEQSQGERNARVHGECRVAAGEDEAKPVVLHGAGRLRDRIVIQHLSGLMFGVAVGFAAQPVNRLARRSGGQPAAGVRRYAVSRPPLDRCRERLGGGLLGDVQVPEAAREAGDHPRPLVVVSAGDRLVDRRHESSRP